MSFKISHQTGTMLFIAKATPPASLGDAVILMLPWLLVMGVVFFSFIPMLKRMQAKQVDRSLRHMEAVEAKLDRLIEIAERRQKSE